MQYLNSSWNFVLRTVFCEVCLVWWDDCNWVWFGKAGLNATRNLLFLVFWFPSPWWILLGLTWFFFICIHIPLTHSIDFNLIHSKPLSCRQNASVVTHSRLCNGDVLTMACLRKPKRKRPNLRGSNARLLLLSHRLVNALKLLDAPFVRRCNF